MKRAGYREAIAWIAANDDTTFIEDIEDDEEPENIPVTLALVADIFDVTEAKAVSDLRRALAKLGK